MFALTGRLLSLHQLTGARELRKRVRPNGAAPFLHRLTGAHELRQRVRPDRAAPFLHRKAGVRELRQRVRPFRAGSFSLNLSGGFAVCGRRDVAAPAAGAKRKDNLRFSFLFGLLPFPCFLIWRKFPICDRSEKEYGRGFFLPYLSQPVRRVRYITATHMGSSKQARHNSVAQFFCALYRKAPANLGVWYNLSSQVLSITTRSRIARHCYAAPAKTFRSV